MACLKHITYEEGELRAHYVRLEATKIIDPNAPLGKKSSRPDILAKTRPISGDIIAKAKARGLI